MVSCGAVDAQYYVYFLNSISNLAHRSNESPSWGVCSCLPAFRPLFICLGWCTEITINTGDLIKNRVAWSHSSSCLFLSYTIQLVTQFYPISHPFGCHFHSHTQLSCVRCFESYNAIEHVSLTLTLSHTMLQCGDDNGGSGAWINW